LPPWPSIITLYDVIARGRYAELLWWLFDDRPTDDFDDQCLCFYVEASQADSLALDAPADLGPPPHGGQPSAFNRLLHVVHRLQDAVDVAKAGPWRFRGDAWPPMALVGIPSPDTTIRAACDAAEASALPDDVPVLATPLWRYRRWQREQLSTMLPFLPT